jgi:hypothetical protein
MTNVANAGTLGTQARPDADTHNPTYQAYQILHWGFVAAPVLAGADKFLHVLTNWDQYLAPSLRAFLRSACTPRCSSRASSRWWPVWSWR